MLQRLRWSHVEEIALLLVATFPGVDPLSVQMPILHRWVQQLPGFDDAPENASLRILQAIQLAWHEELMD